MLPYELTKDTPYLDLSGELWSVFYEYFNRNWPCYKGFLLYIYIYIYIMYATKQNLCPRELLLQKSDLLKSSPPEQNGHHFADNIFRYIFVNEKFWILIQISLQFVPKCPVDRTPLLIWIMAWRRIGDKLLSEPIMTRLTGACMRHEGKMC